MPQWICFRVSPRLCLLIHDWPHSAARETHLLLNHLWYFSKPDRNSDVLILLLLC